MDAIDARLLEEVQRDNQQTAEVLADRVGVSPTTCQRRLKRLRERGVIRADSAQVDPRAIGLNLMMIVSVSLERERTDIIDRFKQAIRRRPEIVQGYYVTGEADFVLVVACRDMEGYDSFTRQFFHENPDIKGFKTAVVMDRVKFGLALPIGAGAA